jgi:hypothetical protein
VRDARRRSSDQPHHPEQVDYANPQAVVQAVLRRAARAFAVVHGHRHDFEALALEEGRHEPVHVVEARHVHEYVAVEHLDAAPGVWRAVLEYPAAHGVSDTRRCDEPKPACRAITHDKLQAR